MWSARVEHLAEIVAADDALAADEAFTEWAEQHNDLFASPLVGVVSQVVHGAPTGEPKPFLAVTRAVAANGALGDVIRLDFGKTPNVAAWLGRVKSLPHWRDVSEAIDGFAASVKEQAFVTG